MVRGMYGSGIQRCWEKIPLMRLMKTLRSEPGGICSGVHSTADNPGVLDATPKPSAASMNWRSGGRQL